LAATAAVVYMIAVGGEQMKAFAGADEHHAENVENRND
jgi:hypothetical protein